MLIGLDASRANVTQRTGTERYAWEVIKRLLVDLSDHQIHLYVREPLLSDWPSFSDNIQVCVLRWPPGVLWSHLRLSWELLWHTPDILFVPADTVPIIHPTNTITTIHDVAFERYPELYRGRTVQRKMNWLRPFINLGVRIITLGRYGPSERDYHRWSVRHAIKVCKQIITVSEFTKHELVELFNVSSDKIVVTPLGIRQELRSIQRIKDKNNITLKNLGIERPYLYFLGRLETKKNIMLLVTAYHRYRQQSKDPVDLVLVGTAGCGWLEVEEYIQSNDLKYFIHVLGWQPDNVSDQLHLAAQAFIFISQYEGFGIPALESLVIGIPVLASRHGSLPEVLGPAAYYVETTIEDVSRGMMLITTDQALRERLVELGRNQSANYSWDLTATQTKELLISGPLSR